jgi:hypothetical protein
VAGTSARVDEPCQVLVAGGNLYVADSGNNRVQEEAATTHTQFGQSMTENYVYTIAGSSAGDEGFSGDGGAATSALLDNPEGAWVDSSGDLWVADTDNNRVREVSDSTYDISTVAGTGGDPTTAGDGGSAVGAGLNAVGGTAVDSHGDVYVVSVDNNEV